MVITLFTDISHSHQSGIGAYAWMAKVDGDQYQGGGVFRDLISNTNVAEVLGLINGVYASINRIAPVPGSKYIVQSDSGVAIAILEGRSGGNRLETAAMCRMMQEMLAKHELKVEYRHVTKGNAWCNRTARALMKQHRATIVE